MLNLKFLAQTFPEIWMRSKNSKNMSRGPLPTPFEVIYLFVVSAPVVNLHAKFEVSSSNRYRHIGESQNFKSRSRDPFPTHFDLIFHFYR